MEVIETEVDDESIEEEPTDDEERLLGNFNFLFLILDSCRYDSYVDANTPNLDSYCLPHKVYSPGWFTQPSHSAMFKGHLPFNPKDRGYYNKYEDRMFVLKGGHRLGTPFSDRGLRFPADEYPTIASAFQGRGYHTIGIGGVRWFDPRYATTTELREGFEDFYYDETKCSQTIADNLENQIAALRNILENSDDRKKFIFINSPITHVPYQWAVAKLALKEKDRQSQVKCVEHFDEMFPTLLDLIPKPVFVIVTADHGDCFGEWGLWAHGAFHPILHEVPMMVFEVE